MVKIENEFAVYVVISYLIFVTAIALYIPIIDYEVFDLTEDQKDVLNNPSTDPGTLLRKLLTLTTVSTGFLALGFIWGIWTVLFVISVLLILNEFVPFT